MAKVTKKAIELYEGFETQSEHDQMMSRLLAGSAKFTLVSGKTGQRFTFQIRSGAKDRDKYWSTNNQSRTFYYVKVLTGPDNTNDFTLIGFLKRGDAESKVVTFEAHSKHKTAPSRFAIEWFIRAIFIVGIIPEGVEILWSANCNRCGRDLTVPESIKSGYGPECIGHA